MRSGVCYIGAAALAFTLWACSYDLDGRERPCSTDKDCNAGKTCEKNTCVSAVDAAIPEASVDTRPDLPPDGPPREAQVDTRSDLPPDSTSDFSVDAVGSDATMDLPGKETSVDVAPVPDMGSDLPPLDFPAPDLSAPDISLPDQPTCLAGTPCNDNVPCTFGDRCDKNGKCSGQACKKTQCMWTAPSCSGPCSFNFKPKGTSCEDNNACTTGDTCDGQGICDPGLLCTDPPKDSCQATTGKLITCDKTGKCVSNNCDYNCQPKPCPKLQTCSSGACKPCSWTVGVDQNVTLHSGYYGVVNGAVALDPGGTPHVTYVDNGTLHYKTRNSANKWIEETLGTAIQEPTSMAVDGKGQVHLVYRSKCCSYLVHVVRTAPTKWSGGNVYTASKTAQAPSLALDKAGSPHIAFVDSGGNLRYASKASGNWVFSLVASAGTGATTAVAMDDKDTAHVAYHDPAAGQLKYATRAKGAASWNKITVPCVSSCTKYGARPAMAVDAAGAVHIVAGWNGWVYFTNTGGKWSDTYLAHIFDAQKHGVKRSAIALDKSGTPYLCLNWSIAQGHHPGLATNASGKWRMVEPSVSEITDLSCAMDSAGTIHWTAGGNPIKYNTLQVSCP